MTTTALGNVASINPRGEKIAADQKISFVGMAELDPDAAVARPRKTRPFSEVAKGYTVFRDGDVLAAKITPCWENGKVGQARLDHKFGVGSTEFHVLRPNDALDPRYLLHFLRQPSVRIDGELRMTGSAGQRRVPTAFLQNLQIPLPPLPEQRRIAAILDQADALRAKRRQVLAHLDTLTQSIFESMFADAEWPLTVLGDVALVTSGITKGRKTVEPTRPVPYLAVSNVQAGHLRMDVVKEIEATPTEIKRYALEDGDLVLTEGGDPDKLGRGTVWRSELPLCLHQNHIFRVRPRQGCSVLPDFLAAYMASRRARSYFLRAAKQTTGIASINMTQLKGLPVALPPIATQTLYLARFDQVNVQRVSAERAIASNESLFASLQSRAFRGEL